MVLSCCGPKKVDDDEGGNRPEEKKSRKPANTEWGQQTLSAQKPVYTRLKVSLNGKFKNIDNE